MGPSEALKHALEAMPDSPPGATVQCPLKDPKDPKVGKPPAHKSQCSGIGMSNAGTEKAFSNEFKQLLKDWKKLTPDERQNKVKDLANAATPAGVPDLGIRPRAMSDAGQLDFPTWRLDLNEADLKKDELSNAEGKEFADTVYHETRHAEQWFMMAQKRAAEGATADEITNELSIPKSVAEAAVKNPLGEKDPRKLCADALYKSVYGSGGDARAKTLTDLEKLRDANSKAQEHSEKLKSSKAATKKEKEDALKAWEKAYADYMKVKKDYKNLPEEADAWKTAADMKKQW